MHIPTHILSGWCLAGLSGCNGRTRRLGVLAASLPDLDGLSLLWGREAYWQHHHTFGHSLFFGLSLASMLAVAAGGRLKAFLVFLALFHLHLALDFLGSGQGWGLAYGWPFTERLIENPWAWPFASWQNYAAGLFFGGWAAWRAARGRKASPAAVSA